VIVRQAQSETVSIAGQRRETVVVGLGATGLSVARFLSARGLPLRVVDTRSNPPQLAVLSSEFPDVPVHLGELEAPWFSQAAQVVVSPGLSTQLSVLQAVRDRGVPILGDIELFVQHADAPLIAITGSNGKSTVTTLLGEIVAKAGWNVRVGGNLGTPALDLITGEKPDLYVLELSSFQLETTEVINASAATVLNISADHMDRYTRLADYSMAKAKIFRHAVGVAPGIMVLNRDDPLVMAMAEPARQVITFGMGVPPGNQYGLRRRSGMLHLARGKELLLAANELKIAGRHNLANALAAWALADTLKIPNAVIRAALREFAGLPHRMQWVAQANGVNYFNDSKGTNVGATVAALAGLDGPLVLIAGGDGKDADFHPLRSAVRRKVKAVVLIGRDASRLAESLRGTTAIFMAQDMKEAVRSAAAIAKSGDTVLLSPACASLDMYRDYRHRGDVFVAAVKELS